MLWALVVLLLLLWIGGFTLNVAGAAEAKEELLAAARFRSEPHPARPVKLGRNPVS